jgi:membrane fusion protein, multidrug efflux system
MFMNRLSGVSFVVFIIFLLFQACRPEKDAGTEEATAMVRIQLAGNAVYQKKVNTSGRLSPFAELKLSFKTGGLIDNVSIREGQFVRKGDTLAALELSEIRSQLRRAELLHEKAQRDHERISNLYADAAATLEQLQNSKTALEMAESSREIALFNFHHSVITAPSDGQILKVMVENREIIAPGYPALLFASTRENWFLKVAVTDRDIVHVVEGDHAEVEFDAYPGKSFTAFVAEIAGMADPYTGTFEVSLAVNPGTDRLMTGFIGKATIHTSNISTFIGIPPEALLDARERDGFIYKYQNSRAVRTSVIIHEITDTGFMVSGDLEAGDSIIVGGAGYVKNGQRVMIADTY